VVFFFVLKDVAMANRLYVGNLPWSCTGDELRSLFSQHGRVVSAEVVMDRETGRSRGFAFVEMGSDQDCQTAINALHEFSLAGRPLVVNEARERQPRSSNGMGGASRAPRGGGYSQRPGGRYEDAY
jgi:RNA recognition motif-containing protein